MAGASPSSCLGARARGSGLSPSSQPPSPPSPKGVMDGVSSLAAQSLAAQSLAAPAPAPPRSLLVSSCRCETSCPPLSLSTVGTRPQNIPSLTLSGLFPSLPTPTLPLLAQLFSSAFTLPPPGGEPQRGMPKAPRKGGQVAPSRAAADLVIIKRPATLGNSFSSLIPAGN